MSDFLSAFQVMEDLLRSTASGITQRFNQMTFRMLVDCLKSEDYDAVRIAIEQLEKERNPLAIPPLYVVFKAHPNMAARARASAALSIMDQDKQVQKLVSEKSLKDDVVALVNHYGNYKN